MIKDWWHNREAYSKPLTEDGLRSMIKAAWDTANEDRMEFIVVSKEQLDKIRKITSGDGADD